MNKHEIKLHLILNPGFIINDQSVCVILYTHFYQLFRLILTAPIHCRASIFISCLDSFWRHPFTAEHQFLSAVWTHSDGTHSLQNINFYQLFGLILTAPIHCRTSIFISCLDSFWRHPFSAEHPFLSAVWTHSDGTHSLQNIHFYQLFGLILTAPIHCRTSIFISCLDSFWRHPFTQKPFIRFSAWNASEIDFYSSWLHIMC